MTLKLVKKDYLKMYKTMLTIRRFEERAAQLYGRGLIGGFCHLYIGQEAVVVGILMTIDQKDTVVTTYRDHGHMIARGLEPKRIMAELTGKQTGYSNGKGGSMHLIDKKNGFMGTSAIVGNSIPLGVGLSLSIKLQQKRNVTCIFF